VAAYNIEALPRNEQSQNMRDILIGQRWAVHRLLALLAITILMAWLAPLDVVLGEISRLAYVHGAMVWVALICFTTGALLGLAHLLTKQATLHWQSQLLVRSGLLFWIGYLPIGMWTARLAWSNVFLAEPRYAMAFAVGITGIAFQVGAALMENDRLDSMLNVLLGLIVWTLLVRTPLVMHPSGPIRDSQSWDIKVLFSGLVIMGLLIAVQVGTLITPPPSEAGSGERAVQG